MAPTYDAMANLLTTKRLIIDTASGTPLIASGGEQLQILAIRWVGTTTTVSDDKAVVQDANGNGFWESIATGANFIDKDIFATDRESDDAAYRLNGLKVPTLGSGKLYIYIR